jgi:predicted RND superfamily exporter protein
LEDNLFGINAMEIILKGEEDVLKRPDILKKADKLSTDLNKLAGVKKTISLTDYIKKIHKALHEDNPDFFKIPDDKFLIAQELFLFSLSDYGRKELERFVTPDYSQGRISVKVNSMSSEQSIILGNNINKMAKNIFEGTGIQINITGSIYMHNIMQKYLLESQIKGFILAFLTIIGFLFFAFRSLKFGGLCIIPNLLPIIFIIGIMGWSGITINTATVMVASTALGIAVDDTVHFISRFKKESQSNVVSIQDVLRITTVSTGQAMIFTSLINITGFLVLLLSGFKPTREFGLLITMTLFFALIADIFLLPASIMACRKIFARKQ